MSEPINEINAETTHITNENLQLLHCESSSRKL